jgi:hypothetical protein
MTRKAILKDDRYKERNGYLIQTVTYAFAKLIYEVQKLGLHLNYRHIWDKQELPEFLLDDIVEIAFTVREVFFSPYIGNVETFCKKSDCWDKIKELSYELSVSTKAFLVSKDEIRDEKKIAKKEQKFVDGISTEVEVFNFGAEYWLNLCKVANQQGLLTAHDVQLLQLAAEYCTGSRGLPPSHFKKIMEVREKIRLAQIPV